jgi:hypothetical protein
VPTPDSKRSLLALLVEAGIDFIVVGGVASLLHGAPIVTQDLDIVHSREPDNEKNLLDFLEKQDAMYRGQPAGRKLRPSLSEIGGRGHLNLITKNGPLDLLCEIGNDEGYEELIDHTVSFTDGAFSFKVLGLEKLIEIKNKTGRAKDRLVLPLLIAVLNKTHSE